jgi:tetratricopeptide (TPR) repeat protein
LRAESTWSIRESGASMVMVAKFPSTPPRDAAGEIAIVQLADNKVTSYSYREPQGIRVVSVSADESSEGRARAQAAALVRDGDALLVSGNRKKALDLYDRASVLSPNDASLQYKVATLLDQELRPIEALMRYQRFLHQMELEKIKVQGDAFAQLANAIAHARERVIVLEKQTK